MERTYDIFEVAPDGNLFWRGAVSKLEPAVSRMRELAAQSQNGFVLVHIDTNSLIAIVDSKQGPPVPKSIRKRFTPEDRDKNRSTLRRRVRSRRVCTLTPSVRVTALRSLS
jgi:hypothetical protein